jgi:hypothetical protein
MYPWHRSGGRDIVGMDDFIINGRKKEEVVRMVVRRRT